MDSGHFVAKYTSEYVGQLSTSNLILVLHRLHYLSNLISDVKCIVTGRQAGRLLPADEAPASVSALVMDRNAEPL